MLPRWPAIRAIGPWRILAVTTLIGPPFVLLAIAGYRFAPLAHGAVVQPVTVTVAVTLAAALFLHEPLTPQRAIGIAAALVGVALVGFGAHAPAPGAGPTWAGDLLFAAAGLLWAAFTLLMRRWNLDPLVTTGAVAIVSSLVVLPAFVLLDTPARLLALPARSSSPRSSSRASCPEWSPSSPSASPSRPSAPPEPPSSPPWSPPPPSSSASPSPENGPPPSRPPA